MLGERASTQQTRAILATQHEYPTLLHNGLPVPLTSHPSSARVRTPLSSVRSTTITARVAPTYVLASSVHSCARACRIFANGRSLRPCAAPVLVHASVAHPRHADSAPTALTHQRLDAAHSLTCWVSVSADHTGNAVHTRGHLRPPTTSPPRPRKRCHLPSPRAHIQRARCATSDTTAGIRPSTTTVATYALRYVGNTSPETRPDHLGTQPPPSLDDCMHCTATPTAERRSAPRHTV